LAVAGGGELCLSVSIRFDSDEQRDQSKIPFRVLGRTCLFSRLDLCQHEMGFIFFHFRVLSRTCLFSRLDLCQHEMGFIFFHFRVLGWVRVRVRVRVRGLGG
jgi:hypothetical protein